MTIVYLFTKIIHHKKKKPPRRLFKKNVDIEIGLCKGIFKLLLLNKI